MHFSTALAVLGLAAVGRSHVVINTPVPFKEATSTPNSNGPLSGTGEDFPCKARGVYTTQGPSTPMALGSTQPLSFTGSAVHGGGSCQISITYDTAPTKDSVWKVIHSIHGGCPISGAGNIGDNSQMIVPTSYTFTIPNELPSGEAVLAWTWFNRIGNREMYMNCAPITITSGSTRRDENALFARNATQLVERDLAAYNSLPDMYVANTSKDCVTKENINLIFPNPGTSVDKEDAMGSFELAPACGDKNGGTAAGPSSPASQVSQAPVSSTKASSPAASSKVSVPGGVFFPVPNPTAVAPTATVAPISTPASSAPVQAPTPIQTTTFTVIPTKPTSVAPPAGTGTAGNGSSALSGPCTTDGEWNCIGGTTFQQCASGTWSALMLVAAGTACTPGDTVGLGIHHIGSKRRNVRFSDAHSAHMRRHLRSS